MKKPLVTVYTVCHNYGRYLAQAVDSVLSQAFKDWELLIFDDGSTDDTAEVMARYSQYAKIRCFRQKNQGLIPTCNRAIDQARGKYVLRLDADDYLDENALLILVQTLEKEKKLSMAYPDYYLVSPDGAVLEHIRQEAVRESGVMDLPPHGACSLIRRETLLKVGKYSLHNDCQDGYDLWLKILNGNFGAKNVQLPLFYYRRHESNLTQDDHKILSARARIKKRFISEQIDPKKMPQVLGIIPTRASQKGNLTNPLGLVAGRPLIDYTLEAAVQSRWLGRRVVVTEDEAVLAYASEKNFETLKRPQKMGGQSAGIGQTVLWTLKELAKKDGYRPDYVMLLYLHVPLRTAGHIDEAIYSAMIFKTDSVISVTRNNHFLYKHEAHGMVPLYKKRLLRHEKNDLYEENGAIQLTRTDAISSSNFLGHTIGHLLMSAKDSVQVTDAYHLWLVEQLLASREAVSAKKPSRVPQGAQR